MSQKRVVKKKVLKKKGVTVAPVSVGGVSKGTQPAWFGAKPQPKRGAEAGYRPPVAESGGLGFGGVVFLLAALAILGCVSIFFIAPDLSGIAGYPTPAESAEAPAKNLLRMMDDAISATYTDKRESTLTFTEEELNSYLNQRLRKNQEGPFASIVRVEGVYCDLKPDYADIYLVRTIFGKPFVISTGWLYESTKEATKISCTSSGIGLLQIPGGSLQPIISPFTRIGVACAREVGALEDTAVDRIKFDEGRMVVHVR